MNLVVNAKDAMPEGGKITVQSSEVTVRPNFREHMFIQPGRYVVLSVNDTGHGMDKETQSRIFEPFFTTKEKGKGTGLGLSTVYGIVKQSGGYVFPQSEPGAGTTFYIYLPRVEDSPEQMTPAKSQENEKGGCETVLLVEDEESVRELVRETLIARGYKVLEAENGESGLRVAEAHGDGIDILITDVVMPGMGGRELAKKLLIRDRVFSFSDIPRTRCCTRERSVSTAFLQSPLRCKTLPAKSGKSRVRDELKAHRRSTTFLNRRPILWRDIRKPTSRILDRSLVNAHQEASRYSIFRDHFRTSRIGGSSSRAQHWQEPRLRRFRTAGDWAPSTVVRAIPRSTACKESVQHHREANSLQKRHQLQQLPRVLDRYYRPGLAKDFGRVPGR
jgi:CheY-like chemotaxis protein